MGALLLSDIWTNDLEGMWTDTDVDIMTEGDFDPDIGEDSILDLDTEPLRYEDYLRRYLSGDSEFSTPNADSATLQGAAPKTKEQIISELAPKIAKPGITPARAMMEAQRMYTEAEKIFGADTDIVPEKLQPDQNPRKFLDGFQNAYLSGKLGDKAALENSSVAAYLTDSQRELAFELGEQAGRGLEIGRNNVRIALEEAVAADNKPYAIPLNREVKKAIIQRGINAKTTIFAKDTAKNPLATCAQNIPKKDGFYDVVMHGADTAVWFFDTKIDVYTLSQIIRQRPDYKKGTPIRLLSCNTGNTENTGDCVAQLLANELEATVIAPNLKLYIYPDGTYTVGRKNQGEMKEFFSRKVDKYSEVYYGS